ncbi:MAG: TldD/PmbA family protein [Nitrospirae bacterium]|nr:TldD/PmbA family protein [Nitrospirota bacterium]
MIPYENLAMDLLKKAKSKGASAGDIVIVEGDSFDVQVRLKSVDKLTNAHEKRLGLRLFFGRRTAVCSTSDFSTESLDRLVEETCYLARCTAEDPHAGLPEPTPLNPPDLDLYDDSLRRWTMKDKIDLAVQAEAAAMGCDARITNSDGASLSHADRRVIYANTNDVVGSYPVGSVSFSVSPIATENGSMQRDYWYSAKRKVKELASPESVGRVAARRVLRRLGARKIATCEAPVIFDPETAAELLGSISACVSGYAVYKGASFLAGKLGRPAAASFVTILDNGTIPSALGSRPFDGEGVATRKTTVIKKGVLENYLLDSYSARKLELKSTGNAVRSIGDVPSVSHTNFYLVPGANTPEEIIRSVKRGLYVVELIGFGVNHVTGDYSRGAVGLWIENGELTHPVEEVTIAGNLKNILMDIEMIGNDLELRSTVASPTLKIARMTVAGN